MTEWVLVPREPVDAQLTSMALTYDHGYGLRNVFERENIRLHMAQLHRAMLEAAPAAPRAGREMMPTIETRAGVPVLVMSTGARPATDAEVAFFAEAERLRAYIANLAAAPAAPQQAEPVGDFQRSAPGKIWMNLGNDGMDEIEYPTWDALVRADENITWSEDRIDATDIPYVRADLAHPPAAEVRRLRDALDEIESETQDVSIQQIARKALEGK